MPIAHNIDPAHKIVVCSHIGAVSDKEFLLSYQDLFTNPDFDLSYNILVDLRQADSRTRSAEALKRLSQTMKTQYSGSTATPRIAVIAPANLSFGLGRMYEAFAFTAPGQFVVFREFDSAAAWLRLPADYALTQWRTP